MCIRDSPPNPNPCVVFNVRELWYFRDDTKNEVMKLKNIMEIEKSNWEVNQFI